MSVIIRLQNLPWNANAIDIRRFFQGLAIPDGGVHIVGGEKGDAFIAFTTDEDARQAMMKDGGRIHSVQIKLLLSSKSEMQNVIAAAKGAGPPSMTQPSSGNLKEAGYFDRPTGAPSGPYGSRDMIGQKMSDLPVEGYRDRSRDYAGMQLGSSGRLADERLPGRSAGDQLIGAHVVGGLSGGPGSYHPQTSQGMVRSLQHPADSYRGSSAPGGPDVLGERRRYGDFGPDSRFGDERLGPGDRNYGAGGKDFHRPIADTMNDRRDFGISGTGRNFGRPDAIDENGRSDISNRFNSDRSLLNDRDDIRVFNRADSRRDFIEGRESSHINVPADFGRMEGPTRKSEIVRSGWYDERVARRDENEDFYGRQGIGVASAVGGKGSYSDGDGFERNRLPHRPDAPGGSRFSRETGPVDVELNRANRVPDLREINVKPRIDETRLRGIFGDETAMPGRGWANDREGPEGVLDGFPRERSMHDRRLGMAGEEEFMSENSELTGRRPEGVGSSREMLTVRCTNFPRSFNYREVRRFFSGCEIPREGLKLVNDRNGLRTGTAYVLFMNSRAAMHAVSMSGRMALDCKVRIEHCSFEEYDRVIDGDASAPRPRSRSPLGRKHIPDEQSGVLYFVVKKLPSKIDRADLKKFFGRFRIAADGGPFMELAPNNTPTGHALVAIEKLRNPGEVITALHRTSLNGCIVEVISVHKSEYDERTKRSRLAEISKGKDRSDDKSDSNLKDTSKSAKDIGDVDKKSYCVHIRGVPFNTTAALLEDYFRGLDIAINGIRVVINREGRATGDAFVEFTNSADQKKALDKDKQSMGHRRIDVRAVSKQTMISEHRALQKKCGGPPVEEEIQSHDPPGELDGNLTVAMQNLHPNTQLEDILDFFRDFRAITDSVKLQYKDGKPTGDGLVAFPTPMEAERAVRSKNRHFLLGRLITLSIWSKS